MALQNSLTSHSLTQTVRMVTNTPGSMPINHVLGGYSTIDNNQLQQNSSLVSALLPSISSCNDNNVPVSSADASMRPISHLILQSPKMEQGQREQERRIRREIANSNERRRMQSINAGFKSLKTILPHTDGEKLSKAAILQQTSEYITQLESDKLKLIHQNEKLRRAFTECKCTASKIKALDIFEKDEGIGSPAEEDCEDMRRVLIETRQQLDKERRVRIIFEEQVRSLENQLYPDRIQSMKLSSSDERRSSSECSPGIKLPSKPNNTTSKLQPCARPLLPPQTQMTNKSEHDEITSLPQVSSQHISAMSILAPQTSIMQQTPLENPAIQSHQPPMISNKIRKLFKETDAVVVESPPMSEHSITVFSHSTKSNQPLKKRAIEIHHQSYTETNDDATSRQPKRKVAKITIDQPPNIGTRHFLPPTLPPISIDDNKQTMPILQTLPASHTIPPPVSVDNNKQTMSILQTLPASHTIPTSIPPATLSLHLPHPVMLPPPASLSYPSSNSVSTAAKIQFQPNLLQGTPSAYLAGTSITPSVVSANSDLMMPVVSHSPSNQAQQRVVEPTTVPGHNQLPDVKEGTVQQMENMHLPPTGGFPQPMYFAVGGMPAQVNNANVTYVQRDGETPKLGCVQLTPSFSQSHFIVAPVSNQGAVLMTNPIQDQVVSVTTSLPSLRAISQQSSDSQAAVSNIPSNVVTFRPNLSQPSLPLPMLSITSSSTARQTGISFSQSPSLLQCTNLPKFQNTLKKIPNPSQEQQPATQTVLCYGQPEITLNQLNAVPNLLAPPRSLHQSILLPVSSSFVQQIGSNSPSYGSPAMPEAVLPPRPATYLNSSVMRCRKSSMSATDSCSTASVSGAEEEDVRNPLLEDPDSQSGENVPTIKLSKASSSTTSDTTSPSKIPIETVAAYDEVSNETSSTPEKVAPSGIDVVDSNSSSSGDKTVSVLSSVAGSPPVIRHIDAIQTRRNLETIVQAIDHLEQQERRNSQDRCEAPNESPPTKKNS